VKMSTGKKIVFAFLAAMVPMLLFAYASGPDPRYTAAPGDAPLACASSGCHTGLSQGGPINAAGGAVTATFSSGTTYTPGQPVTITVNVTDPVNTLHGFQMTARLESNLATAQAGRFSYASNSGVFVLCDNNIPRTPTGNCSTTAPVEFIEHDAPRTGTWTFTWTPPATNQGPVHFYIAGNAVNGDGINDAADHVYTKSYVLQPAAACILSLPIINKVVSASGFGGLNTFASGSYLEITGSNLSATTREWQGSDFANQGTTAPTSLDGVSVSINGKAGFTSYIQADGTTPSQVNVQAPADSATGPVSITVTNCSGTSAPATLQKASVAPGILAPAIPLFMAGGKQYADATFGFQYLFVGNFGTALPSRPAKPGDSILLYAIGLGDTTPSNTPGVIASSQVQEVVNAQVTVQFGSTPATGVRAALYPTFVGLYYITATVPNVPDGDYQINVTVAGQPLQQPPFFLTVHK
jgi:uncharacterized protein (TIGR03437 family)